MPAPAELSVPGKAFVAGEYAVLEPGHAALVLAVDVRLRAAVRELPGRAVELSRRPGGASLSGELSEHGVSWSSAVPRDLRFAARAVELASATMFDPSRRSETSPAWRRYSRSYSPCIARSSACVPRSRTSP